MKKMSPCNCRYSLVYYSTLNPNVNWCDKCGMKFRLVCKLRKKMTLIINLDGEGEFYLFNAKLELWYTWCWDVDDKMRRTYYFREKKGKLKFYPINFCCKLAKK